MNCLMAAFLPTDCPLSLTNLFILLQSKDKKISRFHLDLSYAKSLNPVKAKFILPTSYNFNLYGGVSE